MFSLSERPEEIIPRINTDDARPGALRRTVRNAQEVIGRPSDTMKRYTQSKSNASGKRGARRGKSRGIPSAPRTMLVNFPWSTQLTLTESAAGVGEVYAFRLNSLYDPNATGVGDQPLGHDQWDQLFNRSVVYATSFQMEAVSSGMSVIGYFPLAGSSTIPLGTSLDAQPMCRNVMRGNQTVPWSSGRLFDIGAMLGVPRSRVINEQAYSEAFASGPAISGGNQCMLYIYVRGFSTAATASFRLRFTFHAKLFEPVSLNYS